MTNDKRPPVQPEFPEGFAFLTQLPRQAHPILPSQVELVFPRAESGKDDGTTTTDALGWKSIMSLIRPFAWLAALALVLGLAAPASAQYYSPFIDVGTFEPDFQFFAPAEVDDFGGPEPPNTGVYFDYDRVYVDMNRPNGEPSLFSDTFGDFTWGNRYEIGYMTEE